MRIRRVAWLVAGGAGPCGRGVAPRAAVLADAVVEGTVGSGPTGAAAG